MSSPLTWVVAAGVAAIVLLAAVAHRRRRGRAVPEDEVRPSWQGAANGGRGERRIAQAAKRGEPSTPDARARATPTDGRPIAVDWPRDRHLLFVPTTTGYRLVERPGKAPPPMVELDGEEFGFDGRFRVLKIEASPLPSDDRDCAYLERE